MQALKYLEYFATALKRLAVIRLYKKGQIYSHGDLRLASPETKLAQHYPRIKKNKK